MCQIQFIKRFDKSLTQKDIEEFFNLMVLGSVENNHAFGFFNDKIIFKNKGIFNLKGFENNRKLSDSNFLIGHNRYATTGDKRRNYNNHPFRIGGFILVHNGMIDNNEELRAKHNINSQIETDSYTILYLINKYFKKSNKLSRQDKIIQAIKKTTKQLSGFYSVFIYDRKEENIYYFKSERTDFSFCFLDNKILLGSTDIKNFNYVYLNKNFIFDKQIFKEKSIKEIKEQKIYLINDSVTIKEIATFKEKEDSIWYNSSDLNGFEDYEIMNIVDSFFHETLGYIPHYKIKEEKVILKLDYRVLNDLSYYAKNIKVEEDKIIISLDEIDKSIIF